MGLTAAQIEVRRTRMTATDVAAIARVHPYKSPLDVWLEKTGQAAAFVGNDRSKWGELLEPVIRAEYASVHGVRVEVHGTHVHPDNDWAAATPDGLVYVSGATLPERGLEIKVHSRDAIRYGGLEYGPPGTDEVPAHELVQCAWGMFVTGLGLWDEVAFLDGAPVEYTIVRDEELIGMLAVEAQRFHVDHVVAGVPPPPDGSRAWDDWLKRRWSKNRPALASIDGDEAMVDAVDELRVLRDSAVDLEVATDRLVQQLKAAIGDGAGLTWTEPGRRAPATLTWKFNKDGERTDLAATLEAIKCKASLVASQVVGEMSPDQLRELAMATLTEIATMRPIKKAVAGARPFVCPRFWKTTKAAQAATEDRADGANGE